MNSIIKIIAFLAVLLIGYTLVKGFISGDINDGTTIKQIRHDISDEGKKITDKASDKLSNAKEDAVEEISDKLKDTIDNIKNKISD